MTGTRFKLPVSGEDAIRAGEIPSKVQNIILDMRTRQGDKAARQTLGVLKEAGVRLTSLSLCVGALAAEQRWMATPLAVNRLVWFDNHALSWLSIEIAASADISLGLVRDLWRERTMAGEAARRTRDHHLGLPQG